MVADKHNKHADEKPPSQPHEVGRWLGWMGAAGLKTVFTYPRMRKEVERYRVESEDYLKQYHPDADYYEIDAMRHGYVSARMTQHYGQDYVLYLGYINEAVRDVTNTNDPYNCGMDLFNNTVGSTLGKENPSMPSKELLDTLWSYAMDKTMIVELDDPRAKPRRYTDDGHRAGGFFQKLQHSSNKIYGYDPETQPIPPAPQNYMKRSWRQRQATEAEAMEKTSDQMSR